MRCLWIQLIESITWVSEWSLGRGVICIARITQELRITALRTYYSQKHIFVKFKAYHTQEVIAQTIGQCSYEILCIYVLALVAQMVKRLPTVRDTRIRSLGQEDPLEKEMATLSNTLAWKIPWTKECGRLQSMGSQRVGHDWATSHTFIHVLAHGLHNSPSRCLLNLLIFQDLAPLWSVLSLTHLQRNINCIPLHSIVFMHSELIHCVHLSYFTTVICMHIILKNNKLFPGK